MTLWKTVNRPETLPEPTNSLVGNTPFAPTTYAVEAKSDGIRPLEELMPKWEIRSNSPSQYQIAFQAHDQPDWTVSTNIFTTEEQAQSVIDGVKLKLSVNYTALKAVHDAFWKGK
jgi:hypothetical protein